MKEKKTPPPNPSSAVKEISIASKDPNSYMAKLEERVAKICALLEGGETVSISPEEAHFLGIDESLLEVSDLEEGQL